MTLAEKSSLGNVRDRKGQGSKRVKQYERKIFHEASRDSKHISVNEGSKESKKKMEEFGEQNRDITCQKFWKQGMKFQA